MKILLVTLNAKYAHSSLALRSLRANCREACDILELTINNRREQVLAEIYKYRPDILGISCYIWNVELLLSLAEDLKKLLPGLKIIAGGPEAAYDPENTLRHGVDAVVLGEGEEVFAGLAADDFENLRETAGLAYLEDGRVVYTPKSMPPNMNNLKFAYSLGFEGLEDKVIYYESSRGCPYGCEYCISSLTQGVRRIRLERVYRHLDTFLSQRPRRVKFVDRTFNSDREYAMRIWRYLMDKDNYVTNFHFEISGSALDNGALELLAAARPGLFQFEIGVQSANPEVLRLINRPNELEVLFKNVRRLIEKRNIHVHLDLIAGLPGEDMLSFVESFNSVYLLKPHQLQLGFLKLLKGSVLREKTEKFGIKYRNSAPYEVLSTKWLSFDDLLFLKKVEEMLEVYYNSGMFRGSINYLSQFFESPFALYASLAETCDLYSRSKENVSRNIYRLGKELCGDRLLELMRFDLCRNDPKGLPEWLRAPVPREIKKHAPKAVGFRYTVDDWLEGGDLAERDIYLVFDKPPVTSVSSGVNFGYRRVGI